MWSHVLFGAREEVVSLTVFEPGVSRKWKGERPTRLSTFYLAPVLEELYTDALLFYGASEYKPAIVQSEAQLHFGNDMAHRTV